MTIQEAIRSAHLADADAEVLMSRVLNRDRAWLLAHGDEEIGNESWSRFMQWVERRRRHEPVAYIIGEQEFYGRMFHVDRRVLIPRPATEGIVRAALQFLDAPFNGEETVDDDIVVTTKALRRTGTAVRIVVDAGTGSGCIGITIALERPALHVILTDVSPDALDVTRMNAESHRVTDHVEFREGNGLDPILDLTEPFLLVSNPPYIPSGRTLMQDVANFEPHVALFGGESGDEVMDTLITAAERHPHCVGRIMEHRG